ncbi:MAG: hypothetical protein QOI24_4102 [Acidobacteriota bacterium]|jgi:hypothetical protein|nr:hypothetical protein [Acidobacteriota bacterium]
MACPRLVRSLLLLTLIVLIVPTAFAQSTGSIRGRVTATDGSALPGVTVEARSNVLPQPRVTTTDANGEYRMPALQPGDYTLTFSLSGMDNATRRAQVLLNIETPADVKLGVAGVSESITVTAQATLVNKESTEIKTGLSSQQIQALPIGQDYKDIQKLIPGVMYSQDITRGPSAGGSGQDNVYLYDGVNVTMPLFGVQVADPATHDIAQVTILKGGAKAIDFERSGGFTIDSVSKSGTNKFFGEVGYQIRNHSFVAKLKSTTNSTYLQDRDWTTINLGGPILADRLFFYGSYYKPNYTRSNQANLYGDLPGYENRRNEEYIKLTATPTSNLLFNGSYRDSDHTETSGTFSSTQAATTGTGSHTELKIGTLEGSWIVNPKSFATFKVYDFKNPGGGAADFVANTAISLGPGSKLPITALSTSGRFIVPTRLAGQTAQNTFVQPYIDQYGYVSNGVKTGGGTVGYGQFAEDNDSFFRKSGQFGYNYTLGTKLSHDLHFGYQRYTDSEDRFQTSNGFGVITIPGGAPASAGGVNCPAAACGTATPAFFIANFSPQSTGQIPSIHSEFHSENVEFNDTMHLNNWTFNLGIMASHDTLYGQGLTKADNIAGFRASPGVKYKMHDTPFKDMIQPRLGTTWAYNGSDTVYVSYAKYNPAANSDARAASWDRNLVQSVNAYYDATGTLMGVDPVGSSSGKLFVPGIKPRQTVEYLLGTSQQITSEWSTRVYARSRKSTHFWEDTNNDARTRLGVGVPGIPQQLFIPNLGTNPTTANPAGTGLRGAIGSGSSYVIAELDGAFTKYYEGTVESEWRHGNTAISGSYTLSHYYGNFDQDNSSFNTANDASVFIGSSNIGDGAGRQLWNNKYGDLRGDRRNVFKLNGIESLAWKATVGAFFVYQSGQPYQLESYIPYSALTTNTSDTARYAEPAGRRRSPAHHQLDLNYTQNIGIYRSVNLQLAFDVFNVYNKQTGYNYETRVGSLGGTCVPTSVDPATATPCPAGYFATGIEGKLAYIGRAPFAKTTYDPRRFQIAARIQF